MFNVHNLPMKSLFLALLFSTGLNATTISVVPVHEPLSLHGTDVDDIISDTGEVLQATVLARPMALSGAFPEVLVESIRTPHPIPTNNPNYKVAEANLLVLCNITIGAEMTEKGLLCEIEYHRIRYSPKGRYHQSPITEDHTRRPETNP